MSYLNLSLNLNNSKFKDDHSSIDEKCNLNEINKIKKVGYPAKETKSKKILKKGVLKSKTQESSFQKDIVSISYFLSLESETNLSALLINPNLSLKSPNIFSGETDSSSPFLLSGSE